MIRPQTSSRAFTQGINTATKNRSLQPLNTTADFQSHRPIPPKINSIIKTSRGWHDPLKEEKIGKPQQNNIVYIRYWLSAIQHPSDLIRFPVHEEGHGKPERNTRKPRILTANINRSKILKSADLKTVNWLFLAFGEQAFRRQITLGIVQYLFLYSHYKQNHHQVV